MGWIFEEHPAHEGYAIGYVVRDGCAPDAGLYRELSYPHDDDERPVVQLAAGCDCGWRSPRWAPVQPAVWWPYAVETCAADDARLRQLWQRHIELDVCAAAGVAPPAAQRARRVGSRDAH